MKYFVIWYGNIEKDPLDHGVEFYFDYQHAVEFAKRMCNKKFSATIYEGKIMEMKYQITLKP